ncbi:biotin carboxylase [Streptomyces sp. TLI_235]|nr:ATP-grasp domain-containing protein [Streptomyces sp. TLI_235]PBC70150.1 biotin carboxylase [Streptomyces sp. TLI_235]
MKRVIATNTGNTKIAGQLAERADLDVLFVTEPRFVDQYPPGTALALVDDLNDPEEATAAVLAGHDLTGYSHVVALSERAALTAGRLRTALGLPGPSFDTVRACTDKAAMNRALTDAGVRTATHRTAGDATELANAAREIGYPVIVKPVLGSGADATEVLRSEDELRSPAGQAYTERLAHPATTSEKAFPVVVETYLDVTDEYHCDGYVVDGRIAHVRVSRYLRPVLGYSDGAFGSHLIDQESPEALEILAMHERVVRAVGLRDGVTHFEVLATPGGLYAGEIACRPGGGGIRRMLQLDSGFDTWDAHLATSLGEPYQAPTGASAGDLVEILLPARRGTVTAISTADDLAAVPGLIEADIRLSVGDTVGGLMDSSTVSAVVHARYTDRAGLDDTVAAVRKAFHIEVEPAADGHPGEERP